MPRKTFEKDGRRITTASKTEQIQLASTGWSESKGRKAGASAAKAKPAEEKSERSSDGKFTKKADKTN